MAWSLFEKRLSIKSDFIITGLNGVGTVFGIFVVSGYLARSLGLDVLGEYLLLRRSVTAFLGVLLFGMNVTVPMLIAKNRNSAFGEVAAIIFLFGTIPIILLIQNFGNFYFLSGGLSFSHVLFIIGFCLLTLSYSFFRGHLNFLAANILQLIAGTAVSIISAYIASTLEHFLLLVGSSMSAISILAFLKRNKGFHFKRITQHKIKTLLRFGIVRVPSFVFQFFMLAGAPLLALSYLTLVDQAFLNAGISLVRIFLIVVGPLGIILLPRVSSALSKGMKKNLRDNLSLLVRSTFFYGSITSVTLSQFSNNILSLWLGSTTDLAGRSSEILLFSAPFFLLCAILRSPIDAVPNRGHNSLIYGLGVAGMIGTFLLMTAVNIEPIIAAACGFFIGYLIAAVASCIIATKVFKLKILSVEYVVSVVICNLIVFAFFTVIPLAGNLKMFVSIGIVIILFMVHFFFSPEEWTDGLRRVMLR